MKQAETKWCLTAPLGPLGQGCRPDTRCWATPKPFPLKRKYSFAADLFFGLYSSIWIRQGTLRSEDLDSPR